MTLQLITVNEAKKKHKIRATAINSETKRERKRENGDRKLNHI